MAEFVGGVLAIARHMGRGYGMAHGAWVEVYRRFLAMTWCVATSRAYGLWLEDGMACCYEMPHH